MQEMKPSKTQELIDHLDHVDYPITGKDFMAACNSMEHASQEERDWVMENIDMNKTYNSADEVRKELKL